MLNEMLNIVGGLTDSQFIGYLLCVLVVLFALVGFIVSLVLWRKRVMRNKQNADALQAAKDRLPDTPVVAQPAEALEFDKFISAEDANGMMSDEQASALVEEIVDFAPAHKDIIYWINVDKIGKYFMNGEVVTLDEIKRRIPNVPRRVTYLKVVANGTLNKRLTVVADSFSTEAIKMILLMGGKVQKLSHIKVNAEAEAVKNSAVESYN